jgi:hypothetical protein
MKNIVLGIFVLLTIQRLSAQFFFGVDRNVELYLPFTEFGKEYLETNSNVSHTEWSARLFYTPSNLTGNNRIGFGIAFNNRCLLIEDKIKGISVVKYNSSEEPIDTLFYQSNFDLRIRSRNVGLYFDYAYRIKEKRNYQILLGFSNGIFIYENSLGEFIDKNDLESQIGSEYINLVPSTQPSYLNSKKGFFLSSINFSTYYKHVWQLHENFSLAARVSVGTNLYSEWDQFRKYVWMGVGLEMGFGSGRRLGVAGNQ